MSDTSPDDSAPRRWWYWCWFVPYLLFWIALSPLVFLLLGVIAAVSIPITFIYQLRQSRDEKQLRHRLISTNRFMDWSEIEANLRAGVGTLIVEHRSPKGPIREWWTEDDLIAAAPVPIPISLKSPPDEGQLKPLQDYAKACSARYVDTESGTAKLTEVPIPREQRLDPRKYRVVNLGGGVMTAIRLVTGRNLAQKYPQGKVMTLLAWSSDEPLLIIGDAESVFLPPTEPDAITDVGK